MIANLTHPTTSVTMTKTYSLVVQNSQRDARVNQIVYLKKARATISKVYSAESKGLQDI